MKDDNLQQFLNSKFLAGQLSHAYLLSGKDEVGKKEFALSFIKLINCLNFKLIDNQISATSEPCDKCQNCNLISKESFPDLLVLKSKDSKSSVDNEKDMMEIDVGQIRQANNFLNYKSYYGNYKAIIIENADRINHEAQNSFLKTLEEPKGKTIIFLISSKPDGLLPTIFSRCQQLKFSLPIKSQESVADQKILQELILIISGGLSSKFNYAKKVNLEGENFSQILTILQRYLRNILLAKIGVVNMSVPMQFKDHLPEKLKNIILLVEKLNWQASVSNINLKLALEVLLIEI